MEDAIMKKSIRFIEAHLTERLSLSLIACHVGYSEYHFSRVFREKMQCSVMEYVRKRRLFKAAENIMEGQKIVDVAYEYGWQSHNSFTRAFGAEYGFPPSLLRAMYLTIADERCAEKHQCKPHVCIQETRLKMGQITCKNISEAYRKEELLDVLKITLEENAIDFDEKELIKMYDLCCRIYDGMKRYSGSEYVTYPLHVAILLADMGAEENVVYAGMFCDALKKAEGKESALDGRSMKPQVWNLVKLVNECEDMRVEMHEDTLLIKLAERLYNMRTVCFVEQSQVKRRAKETFEVFLPIARKMGYEKLISELNDLTLQYI